MKTLVVIANIFVQYLHFGFVIPCKDLYTKQPISGFHCQTISNTLVMLHQTEFPQCVWRCLSEKTCRYINHNFANGRCELGLGKCESLKPNGTFSVMAFGPFRHDCLRWGPTVEPGRVPFKVLNTYYSYVAKISSENNVFIWRFNIQSGKFWANKKGILIGPIRTTDQEIAILTKSEDCTVPWLAYTAGETLPDGAVAEGRLADGSPTYVAKVNHGGRLGLGYYNPKSKLVYYEAYTEAHTSTSMDILVLVWVVIDSDLCRWWSLEEFCPMT